MILMLCGPPGAGKSSIARRLMDRLDDAHLISSDQFKRRTYDRVMREVERRLGMQRHLVIDATFYKRRWRDRLREISADEGRVVTILIECSLETCLERNRERGTPIPEEAIHRIWNEFERPEDPDIRIDAEEESVEQAVDKILEEIANLESN